MGDQWEGIQPPKVKSEKIEGHLGRDCELNGFKVAVQWSERPITNQMMHDGWT
jgi:hypothetical protein